MSFVARALALFLLPAAASAHDDVLVHLHGDGFVVDAWDIAGLFAIVMALIWGARAALRAMARARDDER